jgi:hypothetical protein
MAYSSPTLPLSEWWTFLAVRADVAATLTGLFFVAVSINLGRIIAGAGIAKTRGGVPIPRGAERKCIIGLRTDIL